MLFVNVRERLLKRPDGWGADFVCAFMHEICNFAFICIIILEQSSCTWACACIVDKKVYYCGILFISLIQQLTLHIVSYPYRQ